MTISYTNKCEMYKLIILTFIVTALWDVILRILSLYNPIPFFSKNMKFIQYLNLILRPC